MYYRNLAPSHNRLFAFRKASGSYRFDWPQLPYVISALRIAFSFSNYLCIKLIQRCRIHCQHLSNSIEIILPTVSTWELSERARVTPTRASAVVIG